MVRPIQLRKKFPVERPRTSVGYDSDYRDQWTFHITLTNLASAAPDKVRLKSLRDPGSLRNKVHCDIDPSCRHVLKFPTFLRRRACELLGVGASQCGAVTFVQRWGDALNANTHFHCLCTMSRAT